LTAPANCTAILNQRALCIIIIAPLLLETIAAE